MLTPIDDCCLMTLPKITDQRGHLTFIENHIHLPFKMERIYYLYDVPLAETRGAHGHRELHQFLIPLSGSFDVMLDNSEKKAHFTLEDPSVGLYVPPMIWGEVKNFTKGAICLVLASHGYDESDYFRQYADFLSAVRETV